MRVRFRAEKTLQLDDQTLTRINKIFEDMRNSVVSVEICGNLKEPDAEKDSIQIILKSEQKIEILSENHSKLACADR